ncbi:MAG: hypothetical protein P8Y96_13935 [Desulfuromonadales bacterium]
MSRRPKTVQEGTPAVEHDQADWGACSGKRSFQQSEELTLRPFWYHQIAKPQDFQIVQVEDPAKSGQERQTLQ